MPKTPALVLPVSCFQYFSDKIKCAQVQKQRIPIHRLTDPICTEHDPMLDIEVKLELNDYWKKRLNQKMYILCYVLKLRALQLFNDNLIEIIKSHNMTFWQSYCVDYRRFAQL